jgi:hypothetical protein
MWLFEHATKVENWRRAEWLAWRRIQERLRELGATIEPVGAARPVTAIVAHPSNRFAHLDATESFPLIYALHRLCNQLADDAGRRP